MLEAHPAAGWLAQQHGRHSTARMLGTCSLWLQLLFLPPVSATALRPRAAVVMDFSRRNEPSE